MSSNNPVYQVLPWVGGLDKRTDPGLLPKESLTIAQNIVFKNDSARIKRGAHDYLDTSNDSVFTNDPDFERTTPFYFEVATRTGTDRALVMKTSAGADVSVQNATRDVFVVGEYFTFDCSDATMLSYVGAGPHRITAISTTDTTDDTIEFTGGTSASTPTGGTYLNTVTRTDNYFADYDFWYYSANDNAKLQEHIALQITSDDKVLMFAHDSTSNLNRLHIPSRSSQISAATFDGSSGSVVSTSNETITVSSHGWSTGDRLVYANGGGGSIGGLTTATSYYVIKVDANTVKLATSYYNAQQGTAIDLTAVGSGSSHTLTPDTADADWSAIPADEIPRAFFNVMNEKLIISFDLVGVKPRVYDPSLGSYRLVEGNCPDFFTATVHFGRLMTNNKTNTDRLEYSETADFDVWNGLNDSGAIDIRPGDGDPEGITTVFPPFKGVLFIAKRSKLYRMSGASPETFFVEDVSSGLGCVGPLSVTALDLDDMIYVSDKGIHSLSATNKFGDFEGAFLSANIQPLFDDELNKARLGYVKANYIPALNSIAFSVAREEADTSETAFILYNFQEKAWYEWPDLTITSCSVKSLSGTRKLVYTTTGSRIVETQKSTYSDFGTDAIIYRIKTGSHYPGGNPKKVVGFKTITFYYKPEGRFSFNAKIKIDNHETQTLTFSQDASGTPLGTGFTLGEATLGSEGVLQPFTRTIDGIGRGCTIEIEQTGTDEQIGIYAFDIEYEDTGTRQEVLDSSGGST